MSGYMPVSQREEHILPLHSQDIQLEDMGGVPASAPSEAEEPGNSEHVARSRSVGQFIRNKFFGSSDKPRAKDWSDINSMLLGHFGKDKEDIKDTDGSEYLDKNGEAYRDPQVENLLKELDMKDGQRHWKKSLAKFGEASSDLLFGTSSIAATYGLVNLVIDLTVSEENRTIPKAFLGTVIGMPTYQEVKEFYKSTKEAFFYKKHSRYNGAEALKHLYIERITENFDKIKKIPEEKLRSFLIAHMNIMKNIEQAMPVEEGGKVDRPALAMAARIMAWQKDFAIDNEYEEFKEVEDWKTDERRAVMLKKQEVMLLYTPMNAKLPSICYTLGLSIRSVKIEIPDGMQKHAAADPEGLFKLPDDILAQLEGVDLDELSEGLKLVLMDWDVNKNWHVWGKSPELPKSPALLLVGLPGTGKTTFVMDIIPGLTRLFAALGVVPTVRKGGFEAMHAEEWPAMEQDQFVTTPKQAAGVFTLEKKKKGYGNAPLFFDEADTRDTDGMKRDTDPSKKKIFSGCLEADFDFKQPLIFGLNKLHREAEADKAPPTKYELDGPLEDRTLTIVYRYSYAELKQKIASRTYWAFAAYLCNPIVGGDGPVLKENDELKEQSRLQDLFKSGLSGLVDLDVEAAPGGRIHIAAEMVTMYIAYRLLGERYLKQPPIAEQEVLDFLEVYYEGKPKRNPYKKEAKENPRMQPEWRNYLRNRAKIIEEAVLLQPEAAPASGSKTPGDSSEIEKMKRRLTSLEQMLRNALQEQHLSEETVRPVRPSKLAHLDSFDEAAGFKLPNPDTFDTLIDE
jgi:hypothetical protein